MYKKVREHLMYIHKVGENFISKNGENFISIKWGEFDFQKMGIISFP